MAVKASDPDAYLARLSPEQRATLERVRRAIRAAAPDAQEAMSYGMPAFVRGKPIAGYAASARHCAYYPMSGAIVAALAADLEPYETSKGAIRFPIGKPPPASLIRKLVKARIAEIGATAAPRTRRRPAEPDTTPRTTTSGTAQRTPAARTRRRPAEPDTTSRTTTSGTARRTPAAGTGPRTPAAGTAPRTPAPRTRRRTAEPDTPPRTTAPRATGPARTTAPRATVPTAAPRATARTAAHRATARTAAPEVQQLLRELERSASKQYRADMAARYGIVTRALVYGTPMSKLKPIAKRIGRDPMLADALWRSGVHDARMLATLIDEPEHVTVAQMRRWAKDFDNWALVDTACFALFDRTPHAFRQIDEWAKARHELVRRAAFALLASAALHGHGRDAQHLHGLDLIERAAADPRNFVKKGVSWALRAIGGKKSPPLRAAARALAKRLAASDDATERWVGKDALRAFAKG